MTERLRLLVVVNSLDLGGTERHLQQVLIRLEPARYDIRVLLMRRGGVLEHNLRAAGITIWGGPFRRFPLRQITGFLLALWLIGQWRPAVVHFFLPEAYILGGLAACLNGHSSRRLMSRRSQNDYQRKHLIASWLERRLHGYMDGLLGNSRLVVDQLRNEGAAPARIGLLYNGVSAVSPSRGRAELRAALGLSDATLVFVLVANLIPYKGHADLIEALAQALPGLPPDCRLLCVGADSQGHGAALQALAKAHGVAEHIIWLGKLDAAADVAAVLHAADIGLLCSHEEGFSNAVLEALVAGLPMIVTDVGGNAEAVGDAGIVVPARNPAALTQALLRLADPATRSTLAARSQARAMCFSEADCIANYDRLYTDLAAGMKPELVLARLQEAI